MSSDKDINESPSDYADAAAVANEAGEEMLSRLDLMTIKPVVIIDIGYAPNRLNQLLAERYPAAKILSLVSNDVSWIESNSVDFIFANFILPWADHFQETLKEWQRILRPEGLLMLTALGPDTLVECGQFLKPGLIDMHDLGDMLLQMGWSDPVLDTCRYTTTYSDKDKMKHELCITGMAHDLIDVSKLPFELHYEVIHAHAFKVAAKPKSDGIAKIPVSQIARKK